MKPFNREATQVRLFAALERLSTALREQEWREAPTSRLTPTQARTLGILTERDRASLAEVARRLGVRPATASVTIATLVAKRLVQKERNATDRRRLDLVLTLAGHRLARASARPPRAATAALENLAAVDQATLLRLSLEVIRALQRGGRIPIARMCLTCRWFRPRAHAKGPRPHHCALVDAPFGDRDLRVECAEHEPRSSPAHRRGEGRGPPLSMVGA